MAIIFALLAGLQHDIDWQNTVWPRPICLALAAVQLGICLAPTYVFDILLHTLTSCNKVLKHIEAPQGSAHPCPLAMTCNEEQLETSYSMVSFAHAPVTLRLQVLCCLSFRWSRATRFHCFLLVASSYGHIVILHALQRRILVRKIVHEVLSLIGYRAHCKLREHVLTIGFAGLASTMGDASLLSCYHLPPKTTTNSKKQLSSNNALELGMVWKNSCVHIPCMSKKQKRHFTRSGDAFRILITAMSLIGLTVAWDEFRTRQWLQILG